MKVKIFLIALFFVISTNDTNAHKWKRNNSKHYVGMAAGTSHGVGVSYRYWPKKIGIQLSGAPLVSSDDTFLSVGLTGLGSLYEAQNVRLFGYLGNHIYYEKIVRKNEIEEDRIWITGAGTGIEITMLKHISFNLNFGLAYYTKGPEDWEVNFDAGTGFYFKF